ncbi:MAG: hypothetical protein JWL62_1916 [Hyphomicrobiales bacterium]|nr:hypothetical protein [Hyphomicrobiales bacterium]
MKAFADLLVVQDLIVYSTIKRLPNPNVNGNRCPLDSTPAYSLMNILCNKYNIVQCADEGAMSDA